MSRIAYNTSTPFGQLISEGVDHIQQASLQIHRSANAVNEMTAEQCETELGVPQEDFTQFRNRLNDMLTHIKNESFQSIVIIFDQG